MKKLIGRFVFSVILLASMEMILLAEPKELLRNPGFEDLKVATRLSDHTAKEFGWRLNPASPLKAAVIEDEETAHSGKICLRAEFDEDAESKSREGALWGSGIELRPGEKYTLKVWAKGIGTFRFLMYEYSHLKEAGSSFMGSSSSKRFEAEDIWDEYTYEYNVRKTDPPLTSASFAIHVDEGSIIYVDDASLTLKKAGEQE